MTQLPEPNFIERNPETITKEWVELYGSVRRAVGIRCVQRLYGTNE